MKKSCLLVLAVTCVVGLLMIASCGGCESGSGVKLCTPNDSRNQPKAVQR